VQAVAKAQILKRAPLGAAIFIRFYYEKYSFSIPFLYLRSVSGYFFRIHTTPAHRSHTPSPPSPLNFNLTSQVTKKIFSSILESSSNLLQ